MLSLECSLCSSLFLTSICSPVWRIYAPCVGIFLPWFQAPMNKSTGQQDSETCTPISPCMHMYYVLIEGGCLVPCIQFSFHLMCHHHIININPFHASISCTINHHTKFHHQHHRNYIFHLSSPTKSTNQPKQNGPSIISRKKCLCTFIINKIFAIPQIESSTMTITILLPLAVECVSETYHMASHRAFSLKNGNAIVHYK